MEILDARIEYEEYYIEMIRKFTATVVTLIDDGKVAYHI